MDAVNAAEARLLERVDAFDTPALLRELVRRPSFVDERAVVEYLAERWRGLGFDPAITPVEPNRSNIAVETGGDGPTLLLNSHLDTVPPGEQERWSVDPFGGEIRTGRLYGRGATDAKGCLAGMIAAFETLARERAPGRLVLTAVAYEENGGYGTRRDVERGRRADAAIIGEPTELQPNLGHRGASRIEIEVRGAPAHSARPERGVNAISGAARIALALEELDGALADRIDPVLHQRPHLTVTMVQGGDAGNVVPARCTLLLDRRTLPAERPEDVIAEIRAAAERATAGSRVQIRLEGVRHTVGAVTEPSALIAQTLVGAVGAVTGQPPTPSGFFACCDMTFLAAGGIPTVICGPGEERMCHVFDESLGVEELRQGARVYALTAWRFLQQERG